MAWVDEVWAAVPEGAEPEAFASRRAFLLDHVRAGERVLDVGCGEGAFSAALAGVGACPVAVDVADEPLRRLRMRFPALGDIRRGEPDRPLPVEDGEMDVVWAGEVLEHVVDVGLLCGEIARALRPGGRLVLTTPDHGRRVLAGFALRPRAFDARMDPRADHLRFFTGRTLARSLGDAGFVGLDVRARAGRLWCLARTP